MPQTCSYLLYNIYQSDGLRQSLCSFNFLSFCFVRMSAAQPKKRENPSSYMCCKDTQGRAKLHDNWNSITRNQLQKDKVNYNAYYD